MSQGNEEDEESVGGGGWGVMGSVVVEVGASVGGCNGGAESG